ncbi:ABC transporter ATP-binding protein [Anaerolentibacter hominis]|uniref:ABC transporter ATP-binding protein n=1 Tax=Anaerolentibacter hominis TaxID=3079009 RepID=UPI0031B81011
MSKLLVYLKPYRKESILGPFFKMLEALLEIMLPTVMALIINNGVASRDIHYVVKLGIIMFIMSVLGFLSSMICQFFASRASQGFGTNLRNALFRHISGMSHKELDQFGAASLTNRITNDVNQIQTAVAMVIRLVVRSVFIFLGAIGMAMLLDFKLSLILVATIPFISLLLYFFTSKTSPLYKIYQKRLDRTGSVIGENLSGVRVIRAFAAKDTEKKRFRQANDELTQTGVRIGLLSSLLNPLNQFVINTAIVVLLWVGGSHINAGNLEAGTIVAFINYLTQIVYALTIASNLIVLMTKASTSAGRINEILDTKLTIQDAGKPKEGDTREELRGQVEFQNVSFRYGETGDMALTDITILVRPGETIGIIGGTGSGKSTFIQLIPRFYEVTEGAVLVDGIHVKDYTLTELRERVGVVPQKNELFSGTIAENIRWGNQDATDEEVKAAAEIAQADSFIQALPDGYQAKVAAGGVNFSGGQKQRLAIARALVKNPEILILDDSFSALDFATDAALRQAIRKNSRNMTVFIVSQRVSTVRRADRIMVFDDGALVGFDAHDRLIDTCEVYREICLSQMPYEEVRR